MFSSIQTGLLFQHEKNETIFPSPFGDKIILIFLQRATDLVLSTSNKLDLETKQDTIGQFITPPSFYTALNKISTNSLKDNEILIGDLSSIYVGMLQDVSVELSTQYALIKGLLPFVSCGTVM